MGRKMQSVGQAFFGTDVIYPETLWEVPAYEYEESLDFGMEGTEGVKGLFFSSPVTYNRKPTKIAAYIGFPENVNDVNKVPAIVLVHGGLGTAVPQWVKYWNDLGFAAISLDTEGGEPTNGINNYDTQSYHLERNRYAGGQEYEAGPTNNAYYDWQQPVENQWMYHATAATISAVSLISSFDCVDLQRIGMTGISWGSVITSIVVGYDDRISFAIPIYGGLSIAESCAEFATIIPDESMRKRWDTLEGLKQSNCEMFYITSDADFAFSMDIANRCAIASGGRVAYKTGFTHGQTQGAYEENIPNFAKYICNLNGPFVEITKQPTREEPTICISPQSDVSIDSVYLYYTSSERTGIDAQWNTQLISNEHAKEYEFAIPEETTYAYVRIHYNNDKTVCSYMF